MRTDSNTVLSLSSGVPPKKSALTKASSSNGAAFANDFNKAKDTISSKKPSDTEASSASASSKTTSSQAESPNTRSKVADKNAASTNGSDLDSESKLVAKDSDPVAQGSAAVAQDSGKALQQKGEELPVEDLSGVASTDEEGAVSMSLSPETGTSNSKSPSQLNLDVSSQANADITSISQNVLIEGADVSTTGVDGETVSESATSGVVAIGAGIVGLDSIKRGVGGAGESNKINASPALVELSGKSAEGSVDPFSIKASGESSENELSWVLSQMGAGGVKGVTADPANNAALDAAKSTVAAAVIAGTVDKQNRSENLPLSLLAGSDVSSSTDGGALDSVDSLLGEDGVLINEPIELRKKEQEAMLGRMSAQIDGNLGGDSSSGGLNSSLNNNVNRPAVAAAMTAAMTNPQANNLAMSLPPGHPGWANEMSQKVAWIARDGGHTAHIRLDPPELGSLTVKVSVDSDSNTQISFVAATPQARDLLEGQMGRLREMLAQQGMDLSRADVDVSQQDTSGAQDRSNGRSGAAPQDAVVESDEDDLIPSNLSYVSSSGVDYYA